MFIVFNWCFGIAGLGCCLVVVGFVVVICGFDLLILMLIGVGGFVLTLVCGVGVLVSFVEWFGVCCVMCLVCVMF